MFWKCSDRIVQHVSTQPSDSSFVVQRRVNYPAETCPVPTVQSALVIRVPTRMPNPCTEIPSQSSHFIYRELRRSSFPFKQRFPQLRAQFFIGIEEQDPVVRRPRRRIVLLVRMIRERAEIHSRAELLCYRLCAVRAPPV